MHLEMAILYFANLPKPLSGSTVGYYGRGGLDMRLQGVLLGLAAVFAVAALSPKAPNRSEAQVKIALTIAVGILVAFGVSLR
jgi:hypothetical protein